MARYIDADKFIKDLQSEYHGMISDESLKIYKIIHRLDNEPTADVVEVKHGYWKKSQFSGRSGFYSVRDVICSECKIYSTFLQHEIRPDYYCPNCGAKMRGDTE
jgi:hypothetical protein